MEDWERKHYLCDKMTKVTFARTQDQFSTVLRKEIDEYFRANKISKAGNWKLWSKAIIIMVSMISLYYILVFQTPVWYLSIPMCILAGINLAAIGFNIMHDGCHGTFSEHKWLNRLVGYSLDVMGGSSNFWKIKHNVAHHTFTNIEGHDEDIDIRPFIRLNSQQKLSGYHRFQMYYWPILYSLTYVWWVCIRDFKKYFEGKVATTPIPKMTFLDHFEFWFGKLVYAFIFIYVPLQYVSVSQYFIGYGIALGTTGITLGLVFQMAHAIQGLDFPEPDPETLKIENVWFVHQLNTTSNFATKSRFWNWFTGGLNYQVEHHLFTHTSHIHYPALSKIVKRLCAQFNIRYNEQPTFRSAFLSHMRHLDYMGKHQ